MENTANYSYQQLEKLLQEKGITRYRLCQEVGIGEYTTTKWKAGIVPKYLTLRKIAAYFGVSVDYFYETEFYGGLK